jgi:phospholipase/carboxylesterase
MTQDPHGGTAVLQAGTPLAEAQLAVVLLHGRGASAEDILGLGSAFGVEGVAYVAPQAAGHTWYPQSFLAPREANEPYLSSALRRVDALVRSLEQGGFGRERIVIAGFSQGACLTAEYVATHPARYAGVIAFTGGLIGPPGSIAQKPAGELAGTPALLLSGDPDPHVPWARVEETAAVLSGMGAEVTMRRFPGRPHTITQDEVELARGLIRKAMEARAAKTLTLD